MPTPLTVHNAEIRTATVEIKTLTLTGKQVTLAVYRQIPEKPLVDEDGHMRGEPWGWVNHCPDKGCANARSHRHFVWLDGDQLRRAAETPPTYAVSSSVSVDSDVIQPWLVAATAAGWQVDQPEVVLNGFLKIPFSNGVAEVWGRDLNTSSVWSAQWPSGSRWYILRQEHQHLAQPDLLAMAKAEAREEALIKVRAAAKEMNLPPLPDLTARVEAVISEERDHRTRQWAAWNSLLALPQLFIAV